LSATQMESLYVRSRASLIFRNLFGFNLIYDGLIAVQPKYAVVLANAYQMEVKIARLDRSVREVDRAEHKQRLVPEILLETGDLIQRPIRRYMPECGDVLGLAWGVFGRRREK